MASPRDTPLAIIALHYAAPLATVLYFLSAKATASCLLHQPSRHAGSKPRRYVATALQSIVVASVISEGISSLAQYLRNPECFASQDYIVYLLLLFAVHGSLALGIAESAKPLWYPYMGAWLIALGFEIPLFMLQAATHLPSNSYAQVRMVSCIIRASLLLALFLIIGWYALKDRRQRIRLDDESDRPLLASGSPSRMNAQANGHAQCKNNKPDDTTRPGTTVSTDDDESTGDSNEPEDDIDSDSEEPERDAELKKLQQQRLQQSGSWINYLRDFKIFIPLLLPRNDRLVQACFGVISIVIAAERVLTILVPRQLGIITNELADTAGTGVIPWHAIGLWMIFAALNSSACLPLAKQLAMIPIRQFGHKAVSTNAFSHIMHLSMDFHNEKDSGELIRAIDQGSTLQDLIDFFLFDIAPMFFDLGVAIIYVSYLFDIYMALILVAVGTAYVWVGAKVTWWSLKQRRGFKTAWRNESKVQNAAIVGWTTVSHFNRSDYESKRYSEVVDAFNAAEWRYYLAYHIGAGAQSFIMLTGRLTAIMLAASRVSQGRATVGSFVTLVSYWRSIESPLATIAWSVRRVSQMLIDSERLLQLLTTKPSVTSAPNAVAIDIPTGEVTFDEVNFHYDVRKSTLNGVSFTVMPGQTVALVGETGGGKSTILKLLYRYYDVISGAIRIDGQDIRDVTLDSLRDAFGMVPQDPSLFNISIIENIRYARLDATDEEVKEACKAAAIHDKIESFPDKYKSTVGERGVKLSGGELQRVAIARAMLRRPKIVLLDEATSQVDAETEALIQDAFKRLTAERTTFIVAHRLSTIQHADLILVVHDGRIIERGTHEELFRQNGKYVALWSKQFSKEVQGLEETLVVLKEDDDDDNNDVTKINDDPRESVEDGSASDTVPK